MLKCSLCGKEFQNHDVGGYAEHIQACSDEVIISAWAKRVRETSRALEELKMMKDNYEKKETEFKNKYPEVYREYFLENENKDEDEDEYENEDGNEIHISIIHFD